MLEGTYEVKIDDGPVRQLKAGESFYEPPGALHAISRNPSPDRLVKYMIIQVGDPTKPKHPSDQEDATHDHRQGGRELDVARGVLPRHGCEPGQVRVRLPEGSASAATVMPATRSDRLVETITS